MLWLQVLLLNSFFYWIQNLECQILRHIHNL
jgi:hypothetical protein